MKQRMRQAVQSAALAAALAGAAAHAHAVDGLVRLAAAPQGEQAQRQDEKDLTPEQIMARRFPQPVRVGHLIGLPVLDENDSTIGYIRAVVRGPDGRIKLVIPYGPYAGWLRPEGLFDRGRRPVAVPIETVAILARQVVALEFSRENFSQAPTFDQKDAPTLSMDEIIRIAVTRR